MNSFIDYFSPFKGLQMYYINFLLTIELITN